jgi:hypothetical protein
MTRLILVLATRNANPGTFIHKDLTYCTHVLVWQDSIRRALEPPYSGPYQVLSWKDKTLKLLVGGKPIILSVVRVSLAYIFNEDDCGTTTFKPATTGTPFTKATAKLVFREAKRTEGLLHLGTGLPSLPTLQSFPPRCYSNGRFQITCGGCRRMMKFMCVGSIKSPTQIGATTWSGSDSFIQKYLAAL